MPSDDTRLDRILAWVRNNPVLSAVLFVGLVVLALAQFVQSVRTLAQVPWFGRGAGAAEWAQAWFAIGERRNLRMQQGFGHTWFNADELRRVIERVDPSVDEGVSSVRQKVITDINKAKETQYKWDGLDGTDHYFDAEYTAELQSDLRELVFRIRQGAAAHGVHVEEDH